MRPSLEKLLRVHSEPITHLGDRQIHQLLTAEPQKYIEFARAEISAIAHGQAQLDLPPKQIFQSAGVAGDFRVMPCVIRCGQQLRKTVKLVGTNVIQQRIPDQITVGKAFAIHPTDNYVSHSFDACLLSSARTGLCATLAADLLATKRRRLTVIGAGRVGYYAAFYIAAQGGCEQIVVSDVNSAQADTMAAELSRDYPQIEISARSSTQLPDTDLLVLATYSREAVYSSKDFAAGTIISLGADTDWQHELNADLAAGSRIYVDTLDSIRYGDLAEWVASEQLATNKITDLLSLIRAGVTEQTAERRLFISTGSALFDNITIGYLLTQT